MRADFESAQGGSPTSPFKVDTEAVLSLDRRLHEPARLTLNATLDERAEADFVFLRTRTGMTVGKLSAAAP